MGNKLKSGSVIFITKCYCSLGLGLIIGAIAGKKDIIYIIIGIILIGIMGTFYILTGGIITAEDYIIITHGPFKNYIPLEKIKGGIIAGKYDRRRGFNNDITGFVTEVLLNLSMEIYIVFLVPNGEINGADSAIEKYGVISVRIKSLEFYKINILLKYLLDSGFNISMSRRFYKYKNRTMMDIIAAFIKRKETRGGTNLLKVIGDYKGSSEAPAKIKEIISGFGEEFTLNYNNTDLGIYDYNGRLYGRIKDPKFRIIEEYLPIFLGGIIFVFLTFWKEITTEPEFAVPLIVILIIHIVVFGYLLVSSRTAHIKPPISPGRLR